MFGHTRLREIDADCAKLGVPDFLFPFRRHPAKQCLYSHLQFCGLERFGEISHLLRP
jgi:hypothetical protein